ncbi:MAG: hypothetical protein AB1445_12320 [Bacillota bacterium]
MRFPFLFLMTGLWSIIGLVVTIMVIYWIYVIQARVTDLVREVRELKSLLEGQRPPAGTGEPKQPPPVV